MRNRIYSIVVILLFAATAFSQTTAAPIDSPALRAKLQAVIDEWHKAGKFPGATVGVTLADGIADTTAKTPMKATDLMLSGSVGKTYAAAVAMQLLKEGKFALDDKIEKYLGSEPWFPRLPNAKDITIRQLMNHTSGLVRYEFKDQFTKDLSANPDKVWKPQELVAYILDTQAPFKAGEGWDNPTLTTSCLA